MQLAAPSVSFGAAPEGIGATSMARDGVHVPVIATEKEVWIVETFGIVGNPHTGLAADDCAHVQVLFNVDDDIPVYIQPWYNTC